MISGCKTQPPILSSIWSCQIYPDIRKPFLNHIDFNCQPPFSPLLIFLCSFVLCQPASRKPFLNTRFCLLQNTWTILLSHPFHPFLSGVPIHPSHPFPSHYKHQIINTYPIPQYVFNSPIYSYLFLFIPIPSPVRPVLSSKNAPSWSRLENARQLSEKLQPTAGGLDPISRGPTENGVRQRG